MAVSNKQMEGEKNEEEIKKFFNVNYDITNKRFIALLNREVERRK